MTSLNVLWIMADELRCDALSCYGSRDPEIATPSIDRIAASGVLFERACTASPVCTPARAALATGRSPLSTGILNNEAQSAAVPGSLETWTEVLASRGWTTANYGKEHVPTTITPWQTHVPDGSDMRSLVTAAREAGVEIERTPGIGHVYCAVIPDDGVFPPERVTENALAALAQAASAGSAGAAEGSACAADGRAGVPFVIRASYVQPHRPAVLPERWARRYAHLDFAVDPEWDHAPNGFEAEFGRVNRGYEMGAEQLRRAIAMYYGSVAWLDHQVGRLLDRLDELGLAEDTVVVFDTDHGAYVGEFGAFGKHTFAPTSHRVPFILSAPGVAGGHRRSDLVSSEDLGPTVLGLLGVKGLDEADGRDLFSDPAPGSIVSAIGYGEVESRAFPNRDTGTWPGSLGWPQRVCVRTERYRYDRNTRIDGVPAAPLDHDAFLADARRDPGETRNFLHDPEYAAIAAELELTVQAAAARIAGVEAPRLDEEDFGAAV